MSPKFYILQAFMAFQSAAWAETDYDRVLARFNESNAAISYEEIPVADDASALTCVYVDRNKPDRTILNKKLHRIEKRLPAGDPVLGPSVMTFVADPLLQAYFDREGDDIFKIVRNSKTANSLKSNLNHKYTTKPNSGMENKTHNTFSVEVRRHPSGYFTLKSHRTHKFDGWIWYSADDRWQHETDSEQQTLVGYCWIAK